MEYPNRQICDTIGTQNFQIEAPRQKARRLVFFPKRISHLSRRPLHVLSELVKESHFTRFEENDGQEKHKGLVGQLVYPSAIRLSDGVHGVELKLDVPIGKDYTHFKGQTIKARIAEAVLSIGPRSEEPLPISHNVASARPGINKQHFRHSESFGYLLRAPCLHHPTATQRTPLMSPTFSLCHQTKQMSQY